MVGKHVHLRRRDRAHVAFLQAPSVSGIVKFRQGRSKVNAALRWSLVFALVAVPPGQQAPDLTGTWVFAGERTAKAEVGPRPNFGTEFKVRQDAKTVTFERASGSQTVSTVLPIDGTETEVVLQTSSTKYRATWQDGKLVMQVTSTSTVSTSPPVTTVSTRRLWREGDELVSEWVITSPVPSTSIAVYRHPPAQAPPAPPAKATLAEIDWLAGNWERRTGTSLLEERWTPPAGGAMLAVSRTVSGARMVAFEYLRSIERNGTLVYVAQPNGRSPATEFTLTKISRTEAVFENPAHDFPKMISYQLAADGTLTAIIADAGGLKPQHFVFKKG